MLERGLFEGILIIGSGIGNHNLSYVPFGPVLLPWPHQVDIEGFYISEIMDKGKKQWPGVNSRRDGGQFLICTVSFRAHLHYINKVDRWAVGCILFELLFLKQAFANDLTVDNHYQLGKGSSNSPQIPLEHGTRLLSPRLP